MNQGAPPPNSSNIAGWNGNGDPVDAAGNVIPGGQRINSAPGGITPTYAAPPTTPTTPAPTTSITNPAARAPLPPAFPGHQDSGPAASLPVPGVNVLGGGGTGQYGAATSALNGATGVTPGTGIATQGAMPTFDPQTPGVTPTPGGVGGAPTNLASKDYNVSQPAPVYGNPPSPGHDNINLDVPQTPTGGLGPSSQTYIKGVNPVLFGGQPSPTGSVTNALMRRYRPTGWY